MQADAFPRFSDPMIARALIFDAQCWADGRPDRSNERGSLSRRSHKKKRAGAHRRPLCDLKEPFNRNAKRTRTGDVNRGQATHHW